MADESTKPRVPYSWACDACGKAATTNLYEREYSMLPDGWFVHFDDHDQVIGFTCSRTCAHAEAGKTRCPTNQ